jgi:hypothetical protein
MSSILSRQGRLPYQAGVIGGQGHPEEHRLQPRGPSNTWNRVIHRACAPVHDLFLERFFRPGRVASARLLALRAGERVLTVAAIPRLAAQN